jgi:TrmH family RNA methyltransferase
VTVPLRFILVRPRSPGNVGSVARAMKNFGFSDLVLVDPRLHRDGDEKGSEPYFERESRRMAWHAGDVLEAARTASELRAAVVGCGLVLASAPKGSARQLNLSPEEAVERICAAPEPLPALVFGSESSGLTLEEIALCAGVVVIPTDPSYRDLNVAQSAVVMAYLLFKRSEAPRAPRKPRSAGHEEAEAVAEGILEIAKRAEFLRSGDEPVSRELRTLIHRAGLTSRETELLRSLIRRIRARLPEG